MRFVCDSTVGKLARFLRMAGFDTACVPRPELPKVLAISREEGRKIVSRNSKIRDIRLASDFYHIMDDDPETQFRKLLTDLDLDLSEDDFLSRCLECNFPLMSIPKQEIGGKVYPYVFRTQESFFICQKCDRIFWHATHAEAIVNRLRRIKFELDRGRQQGAV
jgi:uncharacterized protein with PIN domain